MQQISGERLQDHWSSGLQVHVLESYSAMNHVVHRAMTHARCATNQKNFARHSQSVLRKTFLEGIKIFCALRDRSKHRDNCTVLIGCYDLISWFSDFALYLGTEMVL